MAKRGRRHPRNRRSSAGRNRSRSKSKMKNVVGVDGFNCPNDQTDFTLSELTTQVWETGREGKNEHCSGLNGATPLMKVEGKRHAFSSSTGFSPLRKVRHIVSESSSEEVTISSSCDSPCDVLEPLPLDSQSSVNTPSINSSDVIAPSAKQHALASRSLDSSSFDAVSLDSDGICSPSCETPLSGPDLHNRPPLLLHANLSLGSSTESRASSKTRRRKRNRKNKKLKMKEQENNKRQEQDGECNEDINNDKSSAKSESAFMKSSHNGETQESPCVPVEDVTLKNCEDEAQCGKKTGEEEVVLVVDEVFLGGDAQEAPNTEEKVQIGNNNDGEIHQKPVGYEEEDTTFRPGHYILNNVEQTDKKKTVPEVITPDADAVATSQSQIESGGARRRRKSEVISIEVEGELLYEDDGSSLSEDEQNHLITKGMNGLDRSLKNTMLEITNQVIEKVKSPLKNRNSLHPLDGRKLDILEPTSPHGMLSAGVESNVAVFHNQIEYNGTEQQSRYVNQEGNQMTEENVNNEQITGPITSEVSQTNDEIQESVQMCQESHKIDQVIQSDVNQGLETNQVNEDDKITHIRQGTEETDQMSQESEEINQVSQEIEDVNQASQAIEEPNQVSEEVEESGEMTIQAERINKASLENEEINMVSRETEETDQQSQVIKNRNQTTQGIEDTDERSQEIKEDSLMSQEIEETNHASREIEDLNQLKQRTEETGSKNNEEINQVSPGTEQTSQVIEETNQIGQGMDDINHLNRGTEESEQLGQEISQGEEVNQVNENVNSKIEEIDQMRQEMRENICVMDNKPEESLVDRENGNYNQVNQEEKPEDSHATVTQEVKKTVSQLKDEQSGGNQNQINEHLYQENVASGGVIHEKFQNSNADEGKEDDTLPVEKNQEGYLAEEEGQMCSNGNHLRPEEKPEIVIARTSKRSDGVEEHLGCVFINENLHVLNSAEKVDLVEVIQSQESGQEDIAVYEVKEREALIGLDIPDIRITTEDGSNEVDSHASGTEDDLEGAVVEVGVLEARDETETDIVIYEVVDTEGEEVMGRSSTAIELQETEDTKPQETEITKPLHNTSSNADDLSAEGSGIAESKKDAFDDSMDFKDAAATIVAGTVDAALAELDSIPDEVCESGDVEEEEEEEEEWSYFRMEPQTQPQSEDILVQGAPTTPQDPETEKLPETSAMVHDEDIVPVEQPNTKTLSQDDQEVLEDPLDLPSNQPDNLFEASVQEHQELLVPQLDKPPSPMEADQPPALENTPDILQTSMDKSLSMEGNSEEVLSLIDTSVHKVDNVIETNMEPSSPQGSLSPRVPGSPRSVEGFITSVELNTPEESFATNFAVNQHQDMFANNVDQSSGPFSVYVSSSPEPASLDPSLQGPVDLINMSGGMTNGQLEETTTTTKAVEESPVEIVHAQSTVEVVAPPSPVDVSGPETQFIMPDQMSTSITGALPSDLEFQQSELSFIPEPVIEPMAEKPVPVYVEDTTPISEPELLDYTADDNLMKPEPVEMMTNLPPEKDLHMEKEFAPASPEPSMPSPIEHVPAFIEPTVDIVEPAMNIVEPAVNIVEPAVNIVEPAVNIVEPAMNIVEPAVNIVEPTAPVEVVSSMLADSRISESSEKVEVISEALAEMSVIDKTEVEHVKVDIPVAEVKVDPVAEVKVDPVAEVKVDPVAEVKVDKEPSKEPAVGVQAKSPGKTPKTGAKPTTGKTPTPGRSTPARSTPTKSTPAKPTPGKATPSRTPSTKTPTPKVTEKRTPTPKPSPKVPNKAVADKPSSRPAAAARTTTKPTTTGTTRPATAKTTASKAPATKSTPPTRTTDKAPAKPSASARTTTRPATTGASKPAPTRTTPTSRTTPTMTKRPTTAPTKPTDKTDSGRLVNGTGTRPSTARSTTTATTRKPATSTARTNPKPAAEKETKNTTNRILSTSRSSASTARTTTNKTAAAKTDAKTTSRVNGTSTTAKSRTATATRTTTTKTSGVGAKKMVSKKTDQIAGKTTKTEKTEAAVIETTPPLINGENKIADEETSVEVLDKCVVEDIMHTSTEKIITETSQTTSSSEQVVVTTETTEVIVNGDH